MCVQDQISITVAEEL